MGKETLAAMLQGRQYGDEVTGEIDNQAKMAALVIVFGASDDLVEFRGAIFDEIGAIDGTSVQVDKEGLLPNRKDFANDGSDDDKLEHYFDRKKTARVIHAIWDDGTGYSWRFETTIPHATFDIMEGEEKFCQGIVFSLDALRKED